MQIKYREKQTIRGFHLQKNRYVVVKKKKKKKANDLSILFKKKKIEKSYLMCSKRCVKMVDARFFLPRGRFANTNVSRSMKPINWRRIRENI